MSAVFWRRRRRYDVDAQIGRARDALDAVVRRANRLAELARQRQAAEERKQHALERLRETACDRGGESDDAIE